MTKRDKIVKYLTENGIDIFRSPYIVETREWQKSGTIVLHTSSLTNDERLKLDQISRYDSPIDVHYIRDHFETKWNYERVSWRGE